MSPFRQPPHEDGCDPRPEGPWCPVLRRKYVRFGPHVPRVWVTCRSVTQTSVLQSRAEKGGPHLLSLRVRGRESSQGPPTRVYNGVITGRRSCRRPRLEGGRDQVRRVGGKERGLRKDFMVYDVCPGTDSRRTLLVTTLYPTLGGGPTLRSGDPS